ncbi:hypothetical protein PSEUBRA_001331 [Kalmanozyma brasiliensis GHG001]|uniref:Uncharacterized protein n=1 Tax=Kalmanozyma brasiliensis (strain GHG001) TaxID=1365824 RepID=V5EYV0_KALBG|nr:uncharacterized protein PSEUBRA_001331 [Kalmanozyma brasiliensis GHG001]EST09003.1 hypothetical protein PSEUBRA_001331 [Kalmanozyma brasiliensis GHG001]
MAANQAASAPTQLSKLLRNARISSFDPSIPQVYTSPPAYAARGEWGMKRALPSSSTSIFGSSSGSAAYPGALRFVEVTSLDTPEGQTSWKEREKETLFVKRFAEADTKLHITRPESGGHTYTEPGSHGPRPSTTFLKSTERYFPTDIPGPIKASPNETPADRDARVYNNRWRALQRHHAARGAADPTYKSLDFMGDQSTSRAFGFDADKFTTRPRMMTNYNALDERQFDRFVERIRSGRKNWRTFFRSKERGRLLGLIRKRQEKAYAAAVRANEDAERRGEAPKKLPEVNPEAELQKLSQGELDMLEQSRDVDATRDAFRMLEERAIRLTTASSSDQLPGSSQPSTLHPHAGLQFSQPDPIYTSLLAEPLPGRVVHEVSSRSDRNVRKSLLIADGRSVLLGGHVSYLHAPLRSNAPPTIDWSRQEPTRGSALFRIVDAYRSSALTLASGMHKDMLAPRNDLGYLRSNLELVKQDAQGLPVGKIAPIGSASYVGEVVKDPTRPVRRALGGVEPKRTGLGALNALYAGTARKNELQKQRKVGRQPGQLQPGKRQSTGHDSTRKMLDNLDSLVSAAQNKN